MKKLLVLLLVLGMASYASAALQISVNGDPNPEDSTIYLDVSDTVMLDIYSTVPIAAGDPGENEYWGLTCQTSCGYISGGMAVQVGADWSFEIFDDAAGVGMGNLPQGENGVGGMMATFGAPIPADTLYDEIIFHCESLNGPTTVTLWRADDGGVVFETWDTVVIHQIPEPATMALLSLGGLFLLRRRK